MVSGKFAKKGHTRADYAALTHLTKREAAARLGVSMSSVHKMSTEHGMTFKPAAKTCRRREDYEALLHLTAEEAAAVLGIPVKGLQYARERLKLKFKPARPRNAPAPAPAPEPLPVLPAPRLCAPRADAAPPVLAMAGAPAWCSARDAAIAATHGRHALIAALAQTWNLPIARVTARWHVLRVAA
jgi:hypothetical protein